MINYIRSEFYRILHTKEIYLFNLLLTAGVLALNGGIHAAAATLPNIRYANVKFVLSFLTGSMDFLFIAGAVLAVLLFSGDRKNGVMKNAVAYGMSRTSLFFGKCIVSFVMALASMVLLTAVYIVSAILLLEGPAQPYVELMLEGIAANLPFAAAALILAVAFIQFFEKELIVGLAWMAVIYLIPSICYSTGFQFKTMAEIAAWMPRNYLMTEVTAGMSGYECLWSEPEGAAKCVIAGVIGIVVFLSLGILINRRKEI